MARKGSSFSFESVKQAISNLFQTSGKHNHILGLDIQPNSLKLLCIKEVGGEYYVECGAIKMLQPEASTHEGIKDPASVAATLRKLFKKADATSREVALAIPRSAAIIKHITIDSRLSASEIESRAWVEANRHFPDLVGEIYLDFDVVGPAETPNQLEVVLVACRKDQIQPYLEILDQAGLVAKMVDIDSYALQRSLSVMQLEEPTQALINLNLNISSFVVVDKGHLAYAHDQSFTGHRLMSKVEEYKKTHEEIPSDDAAYQDILKENLSSHLRHAMHFFLSSRSNVTLQKMYLGGDCVTIPHIATFIQNEIGIPTELANPFAKMTLNPRLPKDAMEKYAPSWMLCAGLALSVPEV